MARRLQSCKSAIQTKENRNASANPKNPLTFNPFFRYNIARKLFLAYGDLL